MTPKLTSFSELKDYYTPIINSELKSNIIHVNDQRQVIIDAVLHSINAGGKRVRPLLSIATSLLLSIPVTSILPFACAIEMIHTYSLIHDDLPAMDDDDFRRGQPTCHVKFGEDIAILAGDLLHVLAFEILATPNAEFTAERQLSSIFHVSKAIGNDGMLGGQVLDLKHSDGVSNFDTLKSIHHKKTGALIELSVIGPALLVETAPILLKGLSDLGKHLGLLFQITDDILDETGTKEEIGKSPGKDKEQNKLTYTTLFGLEKARKMAEDEAKKATEILHIFNSEYTPLFSTLIEYLLKRSS